jgi:hypothetical protein
MTEHLSCLGFARNRQRSIADVHAANICAKDRSAKRSSAVEKEGARPHTALFAVSIWTGVRLRLQEFYDILPTCIAIGCDVRTPGFFAS